MVKLVLHLVRLKRYLQWNCKTVDNCTNHDDQVPAQLDIIIWSENEPFFFFFLELKGLFDVLLVDLMVQNFEVLVSQYCGIIIVN